MDFDGERWTMEGRVKVWARAKQEARAKVVDFFVLVLRLGGAVGVGVSD